MFPSPPLFLCPPWFWFILLIIVLLVVIVLLYRPWHTTLYTGCFISFSYEMFNRLPTPHVNDDRSEIWSVLPIVALNSLFRTDPTNIANSQASQDDHLEPPRFIWGGEATLSLYARWPMWIGRSADLRVDNRNNLKNKWNNTKEGAPVKFGNSFAAHSVHIITEHQNYDIRKVTDSHCLFWFAANNSDVIFLGRINTSTVRCSLNEIFYTINLTFDFNFFKKFSWNSFFSFFCFVVYKTVC